MAFEIVEWACGGGILALSPIPAQPADGAHLRDWRPDVVLSLTVDEEIMAAGADVYLATGDWTWLRAPIVDFGTPDAAFEAGWPDMLNTVCARLQQGARVLVHCRGGCGRSGMVVLAVMLANCLSAEEALTLLRAKRPCAVETDAQMQWATAGALRSA